MVRGPSSRGIRSFIPSRLAVSYAHDGTSLTCIAGSHALSPPHQIGFLALQLTSSDLVAKRPCSRAAMYELASSITVKGVPQRRYPAARQPGDVCPDTSLLCYGSDDGGSLSAYACPGCIQSRVLGLHLLRFNSHTRRTRNGTETDRVAGFWNYPRKEVHLLMT
jgi:hypothetical protein